MVAERLRGLGYTMLGWACEALAAGYVLFYVLPRAAWLALKQRRPRL